MKSSLTILLCLLSWLPNILSTKAPTTEDDNCNMCCHGPLGQNGIPGFPGTPGVVGPAGAPGNRGDRGERGALGQKGEPGIRGEVGPAGAPGIRGDRGERGTLGQKGEPGIPGGVGPAGPPGNRGNRGETGALGQKGEPGNEGLKGDKGSEGSPGKQGPVGEVGQQGPKGEVGPQGPVGEVGPMGVKGNNGAKGEPGYVRKSAFTALRTTTIDTTESVISFTSMENNIGEDFEQSNGTFTCSVSGLYYFMLSFESYNSNPPTVRMRLNGRIVISVRGNDKDGYDHYSSGITLLLNVGDRVWLTNEKKVWCGSEEPMIFTGFMIYDIN